MCYHRLWKKEDIHHRYYIVLKPHDLTIPRTVSKTTMNAHSNPVNAPNNKPHHSKQKQQHQSVTSGAAMSVANSKYSVRCSGGIVSSQGKKMKFEDV